jgi:hypothetical protein
MRIGVIVAAIGAAGIAGCHPRIEMTPAQGAEFAGALGKATIISDADPRIASLSFLGGDWLGGDDDGISEEVWSLPCGTSIVGTFRTMERSQSAGLVLQEALSITADADGVFMRIRHFDARMIAREEKDAPIVLRLESLAGKRAVFRKVSGSKSLDSITYELTDAHTLASEVSFTPESGRTPLKFQMVRLP